MKSLLTLTPREEALNRLLSALPSRSSEGMLLATEQALGWVLARPVVAPHAMPHFARSTVDGYAVRAADTVGASESLPAYLRVMGELRMGRPPALSVGVGEAALIHTGGALPTGADAVVMLEQTQSVASEEIEVLRAVAVGENVIPIGEDVRAGDVVLPAGHMLRPQDIGGLLGLGVTSVAVARRPRVAILSTGDELVPPAEMPGLNQVRDLNSGALAALVTANHGEPHVWGILPDEPGRLVDAAQSALTESDVVLISAGSSFSARDMTARIVDQLGKPGVLVHGVTIRPGKPTILGVCDGKPVIGLPGNPVSALNAARLFVVPLLWWLQGAALPVPCSVRAILADNVPAGAGRETFVPVRLELREGQRWAVPIFGESNLIFKLVAGEGLICVPLGATGVPRGTEVVVELLR